MNNEKRIYIDQAGETLLNSIIDKESILPDLAVTSPEGYLEHEDTIDLGEIEGPITLSQPDIKGNLVEQFIELNNRAIGYGPEGMKAIEKIAVSVLKDKTLNDLVSSGFMTAKIFDWAIDSYQNKSTHQSLSSFLLKEMQNAITTYTVSLPVLFLKSNGEFNLGLTHFKYFTDDYIHKLAEKGDAERREILIGQMKQFKGKLLASHMVTGEKNKAVEKAKKHICLSVDLLRIFSTTLDHPELKLYFDIDYRNIHQLQNNALLQPKGKEYDIDISYHAAASPFIINQQELNRFSRLNIGLFHEFLINTATEQNELEKLILRAIGSFSKAMGMHDLNERIVLLFSVFESLLLKDENVAIIDSITKYFPKLISNTREERQQLVSLIKSQYAVRSAMIHHGVKKEIDIKELTNLQYGLQLLLNNLIISSKNKKSKHEVLQEIDDRIMDA